MTWVAGRARPSGTNSQRESEGTVLRNSSLAHMKHESGGRSHHSPVAPAVAYRCHLSPRRGRSRSGPAFQIQSMRPIPAQPSSYLAVGTRTLEVSEEEPGAVMELSNPALNVLTKQRPADTPPASLADPASCSGLQGICPTYQRAKRTERLIYPLGQQ
ncbi:unnamed protein product [Arctogadus glacialis]